MITTTDFIKRWSGSELSKLDKHSFIKEFISKKSVEFLINAGLPEATFFDAEFSFDLSKDSIKLFGENMNEVSKESDSKRYLQIGRQFASIICVDIQTQEIYTLWTKLNKIEFVNSGILELAELTIIFDEVYDKFREGKVDRTNNKAVIAELKFLTSEVNRIDSKALSEMTVWTEMIDEIKKFLI